jgi:branched-chain amino acid transport system substrate-binding protein
VQPSHRAAKEYGNDRKAYHLTADYNWGYTTEQAVRSRIHRSLGWETVNAVLTPLVQTDFSLLPAPVLNSGADVLVLNHYGGNMVNSLTNAVQFGLRDKMVNGKKFEIVVPLYSELMARGAGEEHQGHLRFAELGLEARKRSLALAIQVPRPS